MYLALTTFNCCIVRRTIFHTLKEAKNFALEESKVKVHTIGNAALYGDFNVMIYNFETNTTSDHVDVPVHVAYGIN